MNDPNLVLDPDLEAVARRALHQIVAADLASHDCFAEEEPAESVELITHRPRRAIAAAAAVLLVLATLTTVVALNGRNTSPASPTPRWLLPQGYQLESADVVPPQDDTRRWPSLVRGPSGRVSAVINVTVLPTYGPDGIPRFDSRPGARPTVIDGREVQLVGSEAALSTAGRIVDGCGYGLLIGWGFTEEEALAVFNQMTCESGPELPTVVPPPRFDLIFGQPAVVATLTYRSDNGAAVGMALVQLGPGQILEQLHPGPTQLGNRDWLGWMITNDTAILLNEDTATDETRRFTAALRPADDAELERVLGRPLGCDTSSKGERLGRYAPTFVPAGLTLQPTSQPCAPDYGWAAVGAEGTNRYIMVTVGPASSIDPPPDERIGRWDVVWQRDTGPRRTAQFHAGDALIRVVTSLEDEATVRRFIEGIQPLSPTEFEKLRNS